MLIRAERYRAGWWWLAANALSKGTGPKRLVGTRERGDGDEKVMFWWLAAVWAWVRVM